MDHRDPILGDSSSRKIKRQTQRSSNAERNVLVSDVHLTEIKSKNEEVRHNTRSRLYQKIELSGNDVVSKEICGMQESVTSLKKLFGTETKIQLEKSKV